MPCTCMNIFSKKVQTDSGSVHCNMLRIQIHIHLCAYIMLCVWGEPQASLVADKPAGDEEKTDGPRGQQVQMLSRHQDGGFTLHCGHNEDVTVNYLVLPYLQFSQEAPILYCIFPSFLSGSQFSRIYLVCDKPSSHFFPTSLQLYCFHPDNITRAHDTEKSSSPVVVRNSP